MHRSQSVSLSISPSLPPLSSLLFSLSFVPTLIRFSTGRNIWDCVHSSHYIRRLISVGSSLSGQGSCSVYNPK